MATVIARKVGTEMSGLSVSDLEAGSVAVTADGKLAVIVGIAPNRPKNCIKLKMTADGKTYVASPDYFRAVVGSVDLDKFEAAAKPRERLELASRQSLFGSSLIPENLRAMDLKPGDSIRVRHGRKVVVATFGGYNFNRPKYPVSYTINGKPWKGTYQGVVSKVAEDAAAVA